MTAPTGSGPVGRVAAFVRGQFATPLQRNGHALVGSMVLTSVLGFVYWGVAARWFTEEQVGRGSALISAMLLVADFANLGLQNALVRLVPEVGGGASRLVLRSYLVASSLAAVGGVGTFLALRALSDHGGAFGEGAWLPLVFALSTATWTIFVLQDSVLTGLGRATWVPIENAVFSTAKIGLLLAFAAAAPTLGVYYSWMLPVLALIIPVNILMFRRIMPADDGTVVPARRIVRYVSGEFGALLLNHGSVTALPLFVLVTLGAASNAHFFVAFSLAYSLNLVSSSVSHSLLAEAARQPSRIVRHSRTALLQIAMLVVPAAAGLFIAAPLVLRVFGEPYAAEGTVLLRLLTLAALPFVVTAVYSSVLRARGEIRSVIVLEAVMAVVLVGGSILLVDRLGIAGIGWAWLVAHTMAALGIVALAFWDWVVHVIGTGWLTRLAWLRRSHRGRTDVLEPTAALPTRIPDSLEVLSIRSTQVVCIDRSDGTLRRLPLDEDGRRADRAQRASLARIASLELGPTRGILPLAHEARPAAPEEVRELALPGRPATAADPDLFALVVDAIRPLHDATAVTDVAGPEDLAVWVDRPIDVLRERLGSRPWRSDALDRMQRLLGTGLYGRAVTRGWVHGDLAPSNVLLDESGRVSGLIDWAQAAPSRVLDLDAVHLALAIGHERTGHEIGTIVQRWAEPGEVTIAERLARELDVSLDAVARRLREPEASATVMVLLAWLEHVADNLEKFEGYAGNRLWVTSNVDAVLHECAAAVAS